MAEAEKGDRHRREGFSHRQAKLCHGASPPFSAYLLAWAELAIISASRKQDGAEMVDGVVDIPLPGNAVVPGAAADVVPMAGHFFAGPENCLVEVAVRSLLEQPANGYNPLVLYGPSGTGKSHVAQGLAVAWKAHDRRPKGDSPIFAEAKIGTVPRADTKMGTVPRHVVSTTAVDFARELAEAIETQAVEEFRAKHRGAALWVVEDLGQLATRRSGKLSAQEELIHTLDALVAAGRWAVITCSALPADLPGILPALQSRLMGGLTVPMSPPGLEARLAIIQQLAAARDVPLPEPVARILAEGIDGTARELTGAMLELMAAVESAARARRANGCTRATTPTPASRPRNLRQSKGVVPSNHPTIGPGGWMPVLRAAMWPSEIAAAGQACTRSPWPQQSIFRCDWPICGVRSAAAPW